jgi:hypothetical protein
MRVLVLVASLAAVATVSAQDTKAPATVSQAGRPIRNTQGSTKNPAPTKTPAAPVTKVPPGNAATKSAGTAARGAAAIAIAPDTAGRPQVATIMREVYDYESGGRRDPFISLLMSPELRPTVADLRLVGVLYDESGRRPVAIMRDIQTNTQYRVTTGMSLGRLRVALIKRRSVIFNIEEFGLNRQDSLMLGDTTKVRAR